MSIQSGTAVSDFVTQGTGLVFIVYPTVFNVLGQWEYVLGLLFFLTVNLVGSTSILSTFEPMLSLIQDKFGLSRSKTMTILIVFGLSISMIYTTLLLDLYWDLLTLSSTRLHCFSEWLLNVLYLQGYLRQTL